MTNLKAPLIAQLELTDKCNIKCLHCYHLDPHFIRETNDLEENDMIFLAKKIVESGIFDVVLTGGEPLIRKKLVTSLVRYFKDNNIHVSLNTNLLLIDEYILDVLIRYGLDGLLISCPSCDPSVYKQITRNGNYFRFEDNLKKVISSGVHYSLNMVVTKLNFHLIRDTAYYLKTLGVEIFGATPMGLNVDNPAFDLFLDQVEVKHLVEDLIWIKDALNMKVDIFEALPKCVFPLNIHQSNLSFLKRKCQAGRTGVVIASNGDVRPCAHNPEVYGNLMREPLEIAWDKMSDWRTDEFIPPKCKECKALDSCLGGCRTTAKVFSGDWQYEDPWMQSPLPVDSFSFNKENRKPSLNLNPSSSIVPSKIRWRREGNNYLICTKTMRNMTLVNKELFRFVFSLQQIDEIQLGHLAKKYGIKANNPDFQRIINLLLKKNFIVARE